MKTLYTAHVDVTGGRDGRARSSDGLLDTPLALPGALGGRAGAPNPEQLFAAGFGACFTSSLRHVAARRGLALDDLQTAAEVDLVSSPEGRYGLRVRLRVRTARTDGAALRELVQAAEQVCAYSNATRGHVELRVEVV